MIPFVDGHLLALGPWIVPVLLVVLAAIACLAGWLIEAGWHARSWWRVALGALIGAYPVAVALAALRIIS